MANKRWRLQVVEDVSKKATANLVPIYIADGTTIVSVNKMRTMVLKFGEVVYVPRTSICTEDEWDPDLVGEED
ncbi:MAG: hypothetical protein GY737_00155 [Desulfobacteraceae bacterium]|nr:hypothetical protein [Desulfobacteraceae bacterium]